MRKDLEELERLALAAHRAGQTWAEFWQRHGLGQPPEVERAALHQTIRLTEGYSWRPRANSSGGAPPVPRPAANPGGTGLRSEPAPPAARPEPDAYPPPVG